MPRESSAVSLAPRVSLETGLREIGLNLPQDRILGLRRYLEMLSRWNQVYNLTALSDPQDMLEQHLLDSLAILPMLVRHAGFAGAHAETRRQAAESPLIDPTDALDGLMCADIGSGAGVPGLVLAIAAPGLRLLSIEPIGKKCAFQQQVVAELGLAHVKILQSRAEQVNQPQDLVLCRALTSLAQFVSVSAGLLGPQTRWVAMKGRRTEIDAELLALPSGWTNQVLPVDVPGLQVERHLVVLRHEA